ncbi:MAG: LysM peptidoglycan-binding domain-containing protein [Treponema sp.]|jgi:membrane-bound lytic murein transglycosylase D|nr:LysM peptidoglycan-binding domain-containing protein [Treponema sp.]
MAKYSSALLRFARKTLKNRLKVGFFPCGPRKHARESGLFAASSVKDSPLRQAARTWGDTGGLRAFGTALLAKTFLPKLLLAAAVFTAALIPAFGEIPVDREIPAAAADTGIPAAASASPALLREISLPQPLPPDFPLREASLPQEDAVQPGQEDAADPGRPLRQHIFPKPERFSAALSGKGTKTRGLSIPGLEETLTQHYIKQYTSAGGIAWLNAVMRRGAPYLGFIRREIEERNLPPELLYLPVIESGYLATALSKSGAAGLWQFMKNSIGPFDMKVNDWMDERMDFWKSTQGALRKLEENYRHFEDWPMALAAYNTGLGGINRIVKDTGIKDYWVLSGRKALKTETIHYVPKLLAVAWIMAHPRLFGVESWQDSPEWTRIPAGGTVDLALLAAETGMDPDLLRAGNQELIYNMSPPDKAHQLKVPLAQLPLVTEALERKRPELIKNYFHTVNYGDTLSALALHYGVSVELIENANPGIKSRYLQIGSRLRIPALKEVSPYQGDRRAASGALDFQGNHLVKKGETLWAISLNYEVDPEALAQANGMELNETLREGRNLKVPIK